MRDQSPKYIGNTSYLIQKPSKYFSAFKRNKIMNNELKSFDLNNEREYKKFGSYLERILTNNFDEERNHGLIVVNTIKTSLIIFKQLEKIFKDNNWELESIKLLNSTFLSSYKRQIEKKCKQIKDSEKFILISTQTIEAGMDVNFDFVVRDFAVLDSIEQIRGRCNREVNKNKMGYIYIVKLCRDGQFDYHKIYPKRKIEATKDLLYNNLSYKLKEINKYYQEIIEGINESMGDKIHNTSADNISSFCNLKYKNSKDPKTNFNINVIENKFRSYSFLAEVNLHKDNFSRKEIIYLEKLQKKKI